jgi:hypothetical protein
MLPFCKAKFETYAEEQELKVKCSAADKLAKQLKQRMLEAVQWSKAKARVAVYATPDPAPNRSSGDDDDNSVVVLERRPAFNVVCRDSISTNGMTDKYWERVADPATINWATIQSLGSVEDKETALYHALREARRSYSRKLVVTNPNKPPATLQPDPRNRKPSAAGATVQKVRRRRAPKPPDRKTFDVAVVTAIREYQAAAEAHRKLVARRNELAAPAKALEQAAVQQLMSRPGRTSKRIENVSMGKWFTLVLHKQTKPVYPKAAPLRKIISDVVRSGVPLTAAVVPRLARHVKEGTTYKTEYSLSLEPDKIRA